MSESCCKTADADAQPCPSCGHIGPVVGAAPVRPHLAEAVEIKAAVADSTCACEHLNPSGTCCLADVHRTLENFTQPTPA